VLVFIHHDGLDLGRRHGVDDELNRIWVPQDDVYAFAGQLVGHGLHARATHADTGTNGIQPGVVGQHGDLGAHARVAGRTHDLDQALAHFGHLELEQLNEEFRRSAADEELRATRFGAHLAQVAAQSVAGAHRLARHCCQGRCTRHCGLCA